mmetsp:Transcript_4927/g.20294  ORF Transcript_4927/g.20294 Transcript_4927/m.20294 type:complete len:254 (+) Transcript_4927:2014-2775(+)
MKRREKPFRFKRRVPFPILASSRRRVYSPCLATHAASVCAANPVAPPFLSSHTGPAMSRCPHLVASFSMNRFKKRAAVMAPPPRLPVFFMSAYSLVIPHDFQYVSCMGMRQKSSPVSLADASSSAASSSSGVNTPATSGPRPTMQAPVRVATSTMEVAPAVFSAYTSASARVRRPSASVLLTSIVLPLDAVRMSPGRRPRLPIMFSQLATMKCASTPAGAVSAMMRAAPSVAPAPPMSNFIISIMDPAPALML